MSRSRLALGDKLVKGLFKHIQLQRDARSHSQHLSWQHRCHISNISQNLKKRPKYPPNALESVNLLTLEALNQWVACPALWTVTYRAMLLSATKCLLATRILH